MKQLLFFTFLIAVSCSSVSYEGYRVLRVVPSSENDIAGIKEISLSSEISFWTDLKTPGRPTDILVSPAAYQSFISEMEKSRIYTSVMIDDVQSLIDEQKASNEIASRKRKESPGIDNTFYRTLDQINQVLDNWESTYPSLFSSYLAGTTYLGQNTRIMKISSDGTDTRPVIWIDCGIHAREWVSPATCLFIQDQLSNYGADAEITTLLDTYDFHILTVVNPDGYNFTWDDVDGDRFWRKNRVPFNRCFGVDLNRNFDSDFGGAGTSNSPCIDTYHGPSAFSEFETQAIRDAVLALNGRVKAFYTLHSFSQLWMTPYGYNKTLPADYDELMRVSAIGVAALEAVYGTAYEYGSIANIIYEAAGGSVDWTYDSVNIVYSLALELRDTGAYGFLLPDDQIEPTATETWEGLKAAINAM